VADLGHIEVMTSYPLFAYPADPTLVMYGLDRPTIEIDGNAHRKPWGAHVFDVEPGRHVVAVSFPWLFMRRCGRNSVTVELEPGETKYVAYRPSLVRFIPGRIRTRSALPEARIRRR
jgi:hypothetical protein